jgi:hypothetical protein
MLRRLSPLFLAVALSLSVASFAFAQSQTVGLRIHDEQSFDGYTMFAKAGTTYLVDNGGHVVHTWANGNTGMHPGYLLDNGNLMVISGGATELEWDGTTVWQYSNSDGHHDGAPLPNGNVLLLIWGAKTNAESIAAGRDPAQLDDALEPLVIYEVNPSGAIVWQWHVWDHLIQDFDDTKANFGVVADHPELVDINYMKNTTQDWLHTNAIDYNPDLDQIIVSPRRDNEFWIIDHSTTTAEAAGHAAGNSGKGGDLLYRWGNPIVYGAGVVGDQQVYGAHDTQWIDPGLPGAGNLLIFNNGGTSWNRDGDYSTVDEIVPPLNGFNYDLSPGPAYGPAAPVWTYEADPQEDFYSSFISGAQRLPNGNTLIDEGWYGRLFEVTPSGEIVWEYQNAATDSGPVTQGDVIPDPAGPGIATRLFRAYRYPKDHPGLVGRKLTPGPTVELYNSTTQLTVQTNAPGQVAYPREGSFTYGDGQLVTLKAEENEFYQFVDWTVVSGAAALTDPTSPHATFTLGAADTVIQANFLPVGNAIPAMPLWGRVALLALLVGAAAWRLPRARTGAA